MTNITWNTEKRVHNEHNNITSISSRSFLQGEFLEYYVTHAQN